jgi:hypothetical protein
MCAMKVRKRVWAYLGLLLATAAVALGEEKRDRGLVIWESPGDVGALDLALGSGSSEPHPPFTFVQELKSGVNPKVKVKDAAGRSWAVKWGDEAHAEVLASRLAWAAGYFVVPCYFLPSGRIEGARHLERAGRYIGKNGEFTGGGFQAWDDGLLKESWSWNDNPFRTESPGSRELNGLKIIMMLTSNWDVKDARDVARGSNNGVHEEKRAEGTRYHYFVFDWGSSMGRWGGYGNHSKWDYKGYAGQTPEFVRGVRDGKIEWGYSAAQYTGDIENGISVGDVTWLMQYLGKLTDDQLRAAADAAGATPAEATSYTSSIRDRIDQLKKISSPAVTEASR